MTEPMGLDPAVRAALDLARDVLADLDLELVISRLLASACELSGARHAALGILDESRQELSRFITTGLDNASHQTIGAPPRGAGVLGELIRNPRALRLRNVRDHPSAVGFPAGHPEMTSFLGVPVMVADQPVGNLYLTDKADGAEFTDQDETALAILAQFAGVAIDHAQRYGRLDADQAELRHTVDTLNTALSFSHTVQGTNLDAALELIAVRSRPLKWRRAMVLEQARDSDTGLLVVLSD